jgi:hypothetical protein
MPVRECFETDSENEAYANAANLGEGEVYPSPRPSTAGKRNTAVGLNCCSYFSVEDEEVDEPLPLELLLFSFGSLVLRSLLSVAPLFEGLVVEPPRSELLLGLAGLSSEELASGLSADDPLPEGLCAHATGFANTKAPPKTIDDTTKRFFPIRKSPFEKLICVLRCAPPRHNRARNMPPME